jgi:hypothetical protein
VWEDEAQHQQYLSPPQGRQKKFNVRHGGHIHGGGGRMFEEGDGLQLPRFVLMRRGDLPSVIDPTGWKFGWPTQVAPKQQANEGDGSRFEWTISGRQPTPRNPYHIRRTSVRASDYFVY